MAIFYKLSLLSALLLSTGCDTVKSSTDTKTSTDSETMEKAQNRIPEGYALGTVIYQKDSECSYIIVDEKTGVKYDPVNMDDDTYSGFKVDATKIYYKFRPLRRMNRCNEASPIELESIKSL